ncbi:ATP-binding cassette domain-containing protein [Kurthia sibirica]|uniref:ABC transporter domain-containing protein n=1 Tax=Kurthia sibirica TaxID=202750 RepID=A0A2U3AGG3_9BACL|nr:ATP-binding cassette domain-containing protein [Kurthia sibirica]PWI23541.1 hypothetical protein DEX24_16000 [Kurthia sibirica]GEK35645.1 hypothetical protein KSI01_31780 [Kurthia sibirica]
MINLNKIDFFYEENKEIFKDFSLDLNEKSKYWLKGNNGTGKTTLLKILLGVLKVKKGSVLLDYNKKKSLFIPSTPFYEPFMKLEDFLKFYLNKVLKLKLTQKDVNEIISSLDLEVHRNTLCKDLSKGTIQKIIISPLYTKFDWDCLFMDEPFEHLDMKTCELLKNRINKFEGFIFIINHKDHILYDLDGFNVVML